MKYIDRCHPRWLRGVIEISPCNRAIRRYAELQSSVERAKLKYLLGEFSTGVALQ